MTAPRITTLFSGVQRRPDGFTTFQKCCTTGGVTRTPRPAIRRARCTRLRQDPEQSKPILNGWAFGVESVEKGVDYGIYHTRFAIKGEPLVSVIIPNKDHHPDLDLCIRSLQEKGTYKNLEFIVIENNSTEKATFEYYEKIQKEFSNVKVVTWKEGFNFSAINNFGVQSAKGEYLLFLNNDTEIIEKDVIQEMLGYCQRPEGGGM